MPYVKPAKRKILDDGAPPQDPGELNYTITMAVQNYLRTRYGEKLSYEHYNEVVGVLTCVNLEFYRRAVVPYEGRKIAENGDVYPT